MTMTGKDEASADGILRPPRVAFSSFSTRISIPCGVFGSMRFDLKAGSLLVASVTRNQLLYTYRMIYMLVVVVMGVRRRDLREGERERERERKRESERQRERKRERVRE